MDKSIRSPSHDHEGLSWSSPIPCRTKSGPPHKADHLTVQRLLRRMEQLLERRDLLAIASGWSEGLQTSKAKGASCSVKSSNLVKLHECGMSSGQRGVSGQRIVSNSYKSISRSGRSSLCHSLWADGRQKNFKRHPTRLHQGQPPRMQ